MIGHFCLIKEEQLCYTYSLFQSKLHCMSSFAHFERILTKYHHLRMICCFKVQNFSDHNKALQDQLKLAETDLQHMEKERQVIRIYVVMLFDNLLLST